MWERELKQIRDPHTDYVINGIKNGFDIVDKNIAPVTVESRNHPSARPGSPLYDKVHAQVYQEIECGNYIVTNVKPTIVSPLAALEKNDGSVRLIHDCSFPPGKALNDYASIEEKQSFDTVEQAAAAIKPGSWFAKTDLKSAYRSVNISKSSQELTGLQFCVNGQDTYLYDSKLPFGARKSVGVFHILSQCVKRMMLNRGFTTFVYIDDILLICDSKQECQLALNTLISLLRELGFLIAWKKLQTACQCIIFLGIELNSVDMCLRLPQAKLLTLREELYNFTQLRRASKRQLMSLGGKLNWAASVIYGGRGFLRNIFNAISSLRHKSDRIRLTGKICKDIFWWYHCMCIFNGKSTLLDKQPIVGFQTDACPLGAGMVNCNDFMYCNWELDWPDVKQLSITYKETLAVILGSMRWGRTWTGKRVIVQTDNQGAVRIVNKGTSRNSKVQDALHLLFWLSAIYNFKLTAVYIPGRVNVISDAVSRLHETSNRRIFTKYLLDHNAFSHHVSPRVMKYIICRSQSAGRTSV